MMSSTQSIRWKRIMERFLTRHRDRIAGTITGFDRMLFRGTLRSISHCHGLEIFLSSQRVLLKDFAKFAQQLSHEISEHGKAFAAQMGRPYNIWIRPRWPRSNWRARSWNETRLTKGSFVCSPR